MKRNGRTIVAVIISTLLLGGLAFAMMNADAPLFSASLAQDSQVNMAASQNYIPDDMHLVVAGIARPFTSGDTLPVSGDVMAKVTVERGEERYSRIVDLYLYHLATSKPLDDAGVQLTGSMRYMDHGTFRAVTVQSEGGHYILNLPFIMPGEWEVDLDIGISGRQNKIQLEIDLYQ
jgi:hypothetical protein